MKEIFINNAEVTIKTNDNSILNNKENNAMKNTINIEELSKAVAQAITREVEEIKNPRVNYYGGQWAKNSKYYGTEICGYVYNPYMVRRFVPRQFMDMYRRSRRENMNEQIKWNITYKDMLTFLTEECKTLELLEKRDQIAFDERSAFYTVNVIKRSVMEYITTLDKFIRKSVEGMDESRTVNIGGLITKVIVEEKIVCHTYIRTVTPAICDELGRLAGEIHHSYTYKQLNKVIAKIPVVSIPREYIIHYSYGAGKYIHTYNPIGYTLPKEFIEAYKKTGAYYTLKDKIMFNDWRFEGKKGREAVAILRGYINEEGYVLYAKFKEAFRIN